MIILSLIGIAVLALAMAAPDVLGAQQLHQIAAGLLLMVPAVVSEMFGGRRK